MSRARLRKAAVGKSDGVRFTVRAGCDGVSRTAEVFNRQAKAVPLKLDLSQFAGRDICLSLEVDAGPQANPSFDWALLEEPRIILQSTNDLTEQSIRLAGTNQLTVGLTFTGQTPLAQHDDGTAVISLPIPGSLILPHHPPHKVQLPCDLLKTPFSSHLVFRDGIELPSYGYFGGAIVQAKCDGVERRSLSLHPPTAGRSFADYLLQLPHASTKLITAIGVRDGSKSEGLAFEIQVNGCQIFRQSVRIDSGWIPVEVDLARWRGQPVLLSFVTDPEGGYQFDWAVWAKPRLVTAGP
jgi:hypothetical protein